MSGLARGLKHLQAALRSLAPSRRRLREELAQAQAALAEARRQSSAFIEALGVAVYTTDAEGRITSYNEAAAELWGHRPTLGDSRWCGSWRLFWPDGTPLAHEDCPMAIALREGRPVRGTEAVAERPDGSRVPFLPYPTPLLDAEGRLAGAVNVLVDLSGLRSAEAARFESEAHLGAIVDTTPECIKLVAPDGTLLRINRAGLAMCQAAREEIEGSSVFDRLPPEHRELWRRNHERVCQGESLSWEFDLLGPQGDRRHMETHAAPLRLTDGRLAQLSITRDVTQRKAAEERQALLLREVDHRAKNALAVALSMVRLTRTQDPRGFAEAVEGRIAALAHAHTLLAEEGWTGAGLRGIAEREFSGRIEAGRVSLQGDDVTVAAGAVQPVAVVLHELATNATKHGALSVPEGGSSSPGGVRPMAACA